MAPKNTFAVRLDDDLNAELDRLSGLEQRSKSNMIRLLLREALDARTKQLRK